MRELALNLLRTALADPQAEFRPDQWESIRRILDRERLLLVQRTGWGKSIVYFLATKLLRNNGAGPALLISPLLSLMRNQLEAAERIGVRARTINSTNAEMWEEVEEELREDAVDILLISPERLANDTFRQNVLTDVAPHIGLFVVDEAHCISDWGHDFRPDYRRIVRVLEFLPPNVPVLATTATANDRVVNDVILQLGNIELIRGPLVRESLKLQNISMPSPAARLAWLAEVIPTLPGSGIVYALTKRDSERVTEWLQINGIIAEAYHADVGNENEERNIRAELEQRLLANEVKVLVATVALGMGFDKPDLGFVIHFQRPGSVIHYYQQVGRAGRAVDEAFGILLYGEEDDNIVDFFIRNAFPPQQNVAAILEELEHSEEGLSIRSMESKLNLRKGQIGKAVKFLTVESPSPIVKVGSKWRVTATAANYIIDQEYVQQITEIRQAEQSQMQDYMDHTGCLMAFLQRSLDDPNPQNCGKCRNCNPELLLPESYDDDLANQAAIFLKRSYQTIAPRKQWPSCNPMPVYNFTGRIGEELRASEGRALSLWRDAGWGQLVAQRKYEDEFYSDDLVNACAEMLAEWKPDLHLEWITCIPSFNHPDLVPDFARRLAETLGLPYVACIEKVKTNSQQKHMENSFQQTRNLDGVFRVNPFTQLSAPCLLVDDVIDSGWTLTVAAALLRQEGCSGVYPMALALNSPRMI